MNLDLKVASVSCSCRDSDVQEMQNDLDRETSSLQELEAQKQDAQDRLDEMDQQKAKLEDMLNEVRQKCQEESQMVSPSRSSAPSTHVGVGILKLFGFSNIFKMCFNKLG